MPFCPKCSTEYLPDIDICQDCNVELVAEPPPPIPEEYKDVDWVELYTFPGTLYARMAIELLTREGIPSYTQSDLTAATLGVGSSADYFGATGTVFVLEPDYDRGREVIETMVDELPGSSDENLPDEEEE